MKLQKNTINDDENTINLDKISFNFSKIMVNFLLHERKADFYSSYVQQVLAKKYSWA